MTYKIWVKINGVWVMVGEYDNQDTAESVMARMITTSFPMLVRRDDNEPWPKEGQL
jgi:hypothetical protein